MSTAPRRSVRRRRARPRIRRRRAIAAALLASVLACGPVEEVPPAIGDPVEPALGDAVDGPRREPRRDVHEALRAERDVVHHPADGGGRAWLVDDAVRIAGARDRFELIYEAGPRGVAAG
ncbi:MAG: hypothetical protein AAGF23_15845, partial [Acidobacteriota bacterium]